MYVVALVEIEPNQVVEVPSHIGKVLKDFPDVMPPQLLKTLTLRCAFDHKI